MQEEAFEYNHTTQDEIKHINWYTYKSTKKGTPIERLLRYSKAAQGRADWGQIDKKAIFRHIVRELTILETQGASK